MARLYRPEAMLDGSHVAMSGTIITTARPASMISTKGLDAAVDRCEMRSLGDYWRSRYKATAASA